MTAARAEVPGGSDLSTWPLRYLLLGARALGLATLGLLAVTALTPISNVFVSAYVLEDWTLVILSVLQGFAFRWWLDRG